MTALGAPHSSCFTAGFQEGAVNCQGSSPACSIPASSPASTPFPARALCSLTWLKSNWIKAISVQSDWPPEASQHDLSNFLRSTRKEETEDCDGKVRPCGVATGVSHYGTHTFQLQSEIFFYSEMKLSCEARAVARNSMQQKPPLTNGPLAITVSREAKDVTPRTLKSTSEKEDLPATSTASELHPKVRDTLGVNPHMGEVHATQQTPG